MLSTDIAKRRHLEQTCPTPSELGKCGRTSSELHEVKEHRRGGHGLHVSLQVKAFGKFIDIVEGKGEIESVCYQVAGRVVQDMSKYFSFECNREAEFLSATRKLFPGCCIEKASVARAQSDCTMAVTVDGKAYKVANFEFKNELNGTSSDPYNQNIGYFIHLQSPLENERAPMLLVSLVGCHYFQVFGAVWNGGALCIDPLCSPASLLCVPSDPLHCVGKLARIFAAMKEAVCELESYYSSSQRWKKGPYFSSPDILECEKNMGLEWLYEAERCSGEKVVVKFVRQYGKEVHECLADAGLAPKLYSCEPLHGGWHAIVMEKIVGGTIQAPVSTAVRDALQKVLQLLDTHRYVHGDLRPQNILLVNDSVSVLDFDWAGKEGIARYPHELNMENDWHHGVKSGGIISNEHDKYEVGKIITARQ